MTPAQGHNAAAKALLGFQIDAGVVSGPFGAGIRERLLLVIDTVGESGVVCEPPCADEGRRICLALGFVGQNAGREKGALGVARGIADFDGMLLSHETQRAAPGLLLILIVAVVNQCKCCGVVTAIVFVVARNIGCRNLQ